MQTMLPTTCLRKMWIYWKRYRKKLPLMVCDNDKSLVIWKIGWITSDNIGTRKLHGDMIELLRIFKRFVGLSVNYLWNPFNYTMSVNVDIQKNQCKKTVVYHLVNGSTLLLCIKNSKNDRLNVILLVAIWLNVNVLHSSITFSLSFLLFSMHNNNVEPLTTCRW